jgi:uncharacterized protein YdaU (DUF1376 family)
VLCLTVLQLRKETIAIETFFHWKVVDVHYYTHHIGDFIKDTSNLDDHHLAAYLRMIWRYYLGESPLKGECEDIAFAVRSDEKTVRTLLRHFFKESENGWHHTRCDKVIADFYAKSEKARESAKMRWDSERNANALKKDANELKSDAKSMLPITHNPLTHNPIIKNTALTRPEFVSEDVWSDFEKLRKAKKAPLTATALKGIQAESDKAGITLEAALVMACNRGWTSFKADWIKPDALKRQANFADAARQTVPSSGEHEKTRESMAKTFEGAKPPSIEQLAMLLAAAKGKS